jgi:hypothetical protein
MRDKCYPTHDVKEKVRSLIIGGGDAVMHFTAEAQRREVPQRIQVAEFILHDLIHFTSS